MHQKDVARPAYSRYEVHEVVTRHGLVVISDGDSLDIELRADAETESLDSVQYIQQNEADDYCSHDGHEWEEVYERAYGTGYGEADWIHESVTLLVEKEIRDWHDQVHEGPSVTCPEDPCRPVLSALTEARVSARQGGC